MPSRLSSSLSDTPLKTSSNSVDPKIIVALDFDSMAECEALLPRLDPLVCHLKVGKELFTACGPKVVEVIHKCGFQVFLDLKFHDIPATVAKAVTAAANLGVWMVNVHASGGPRMLESAAEARARATFKPLLIGVTVLTSMEQPELDAVGINCPLEDQVMRLAGLVRDAGLDGVVCSAREANALKDAYGQDFVLVTPGIRPVGIDAGDQRRIVTPEAALLAGSHYLVIGRPITQSPDPAATCREIVRSLPSI
jgi:orotidine-5'-phosphate decarboxylase